MERSLFTVTEIEISYKPRLPLVFRPKIMSSNEAYQRLLLLFDPVLLPIREEAAVLLLNRANKLIGGYRISSGGITGTVVDIRLVLAVALKSLATGLIIAHTHPSGQLVPSEADKALTMRFKEAAACMDIRLLDHLILTEDGYYSFADEGEMR